MTTITDNIYIERKDVKWLRDQAKSNLLEIDNSFQRQYIWTVKNQARLIETILLGYAIPEIYLWERRTDSQTGETVFSIIDGQQRLGSIFDFINNEFQLKTSYVEVKNADYANKFFKDLTDGQRSQLWKYPLSVRFIKESVNRDDIVNMFLRLNSTSTTLNPQELRNAEFNGLFLRLANELSSLPIWERIKLFTGYDYRRMKDIEFISSLLIFIRLGIEEETTQTNINKIYDTFNESYDDYEEDSNLFQQLISVIENFSNHNIEINKFLERKVHFYSLFTLAYYLVKSNINLDNSHLNKYAEFVDYYNSIDAADSTVNPKYHRLVETYRLVSQEATQSKKSRITRFEILKELIK